MADAHDPFPACDVCGRTILKGEQIHEYLTSQRQRIRVCVLCRSRAETSGWIPVAMAHTLEDEQPRRSRGQALRKRLGRAASRARSSARSRREPDRDAHRDAGLREFEQAWEEPPMAPESLGADDDANIAPEQPVAETEPAPVDAPAPSEPPEAEAEPHPEPVAAAAAEPAPEPTPQPEKRVQPATPRKAAKPRTRREPRARTAKGSAKPAEERAKPARKSPAKRGPEALMRRAVERFNSSEERRKVAGLIRSLGEPQAGVRPDPRRQLAVVTVGWELSWYQWEVGADGEGEDSEPVREVAKGAELSELTEDARSWNAAVDEDGTLRLQAAERPKQEAAKEA